MLSGIVQYTLEHSREIAIKPVSIHVVYPYSSIDTTAAWKKLQFILSDRFGFHITDNLSIAVHLFASHVLMSFSVDETLVPRYGNLATRFREPSFRVEMVLC